MHLSKIFIYPIKSLPGIEVKQAQIDQVGLINDRRWMLIDENNRAVTQREFAELSQFRTSISSLGEIEISHKNHPENKISLPFQPKIGSQEKVSIWNDECNAIVAENDINQTLSTWLNKKVRLVHLPNSNSRQVNPSYAKIGQTTAFTDGFPLLIIGQASLDLLNSKLTYPVTIERFRPNFVFEGGIPHCEDAFGSFSIGELNFKAVKPCSRCVITTIDPQTSLKSTEPLKTLATYRTIDNKVMFGMNVLIESIGTVSINDPIIVK